RHVPLSVWAARTAPAVSPRATWAEKAAPKPARLASSFCTNPESTSLGPVARSMRRISSISAGSMRAVMARSARGGGEPAIDHQDVARHPARFVAREENRGPAHVPAGAFGAQRRGAAAPLTRFGAEPLHHRGPDLARRDA